MGRPKAEYKNKKFIFTLPPLLKARLEAQAKYESDQSFDEVSLALVIRKGLEIYLRQNPLPDGYFQNYLEGIQDEKERKKLMELFEKYKKHDPEGLFKP